MHASAGLRPPCALATAQRARRSARDHVACRAAADAAAPSAPPGRRAACLQLAVAAAVAARLAAPSAAAAAGDPPLDATFGALGGALGACDAGGDAVVCLSTFDDRPKHFAPPWEFEGTPEEAAAALRAAVVAEGGVLADAEAASPLYTRAAFTSASPGAPPDIDVEFLLQTDGDATVAVRAVARPPAPGALPRPDLGRTAERLYRVRRRLKWDEVFVLRSRDNALLETPLDGFGPVPPAGGVDYARGGLDDPLAK